MCVRVSIFVQEGVFSSQNFLVFTIVALSLVFVN
jgi:hypothetical protein